MYGTLLTITRKPLEGKLLEVLSRTIEGSKANGRPNLVTATVAAPPPNGVDVNQILRFESFEQFEEFQDGFLADDSWTARWDEGASSCHYVSSELFEVIWPVEGGSDSSTPKFLARTDLVSKPGKRSELIDALIDQREHLTSGSPKPNVRKPISSVDRVRATRPFASYSALVESLTQLESPENRSNFGRIVSLSDQITRSVFRIMHSTY